MNKVLIDGALSLHAKGCAVIAVRENKAPYREGWTRWLKEKQTEQEVRREFANGAYGLGVLMWPGSPYVALDFDGVHAEEAWKSSGFEFIETARNVTRSGGVHLILRVPPDFTEDLKRQIRLVRVNCDCRKNGKPAPCGVDLLLNGFACFPPTPSYHEDADHPLESAVEIPSAIIEFALKLQRAGRSGPKTTGDSQGRVTQGERHSTLVSLAGSMFARGMSPEAIRAALKADNETRFDPPLGERDIENVMKSVGKWSQSPAEIKKLTDYGNAERLVNQHHDSIRYCPQLGWLTWDGRHWCVDETGEVERRAKLTVRSIYLEAANCEENDVRERLSEWAHRSEAAGRLKAMIDLVRSEPGVAIAQKDLDRDPWLLNVANGTIDLKTGTLREHRREDFITRTIEVDYDPAAECTLWEFFLEKITGGNKSLARFIQKYAGYSLTGVNSEQCFCILYGTGSNGKSTLLKVLGGLLGDYARHTPTETLLVKRGDQISNDIARLAGARMVTAIESEGGRRMAEALIKQLTGGDKIAARFLHREFFEFEPNFKLWLASNHKPRIKGSDNAIWRRIHLIPFEVMIPENERDRDLGEKLRSERPGILRWAVEGCKLWREEGLAAPATVKAATNQYREESDIVASFIEECCVLGEGCTVKKAGLYASYAEWCKNSGEGPLTKMISERD
jgi:putative DNA primase/helicase